MIRAATKTSVNTETYTKPRINVIEDHFELFLRCSNMEESRIEKILLAIEKHELQAVGIYISDNNYKVAEVRFEIDWEEHKELTHIHGNLFDTDLPGWKDGVAPEAYVSVSRLVKAAKEQNLSVRSYISVADFIRENEDEYKRVCDELGYSFNGSGTKWKEQPQEQARRIEGLSEARVIRKQIMI